MIDFGSLIKESRAKKRLSLHELSKESGVPITTIHNYERGVEPTLKKADLILRALGISVTLGK
jgi:transcriptional regulator with XRE-family HTH domain